MSPQGPTGYCEIEKVTQTEDLGVRHIVGIKLKVAPSL